MSERYISIHGHFYQPPREDPWLEAIEVQDSAYPYHDWNERVTAESYAPNGASRILDGEGRILKIVNNYARISFDFGPTLLSWMREKVPTIYQTILEADKQSQKRFSGHGSALAQAYNHMILPLANHRDKRTQIRWGIGDFEYRFGRPPEGMWLPETAVDLETLELLAQHGLQFTILSPNQARRVRPIGGRAWRDISGGRIDPSRAYRLRLASGRQISLFFYDGPISRAVAFEGLLSKGEDLVSRLLGAFSDSRDWAQLVHIATDGETYGHHHRHGDMALAYALEHLESDQVAKLTNYGAYLEAYPPTQEVQIFENSSWSCPHGVERWRSNCGCNTGGHPGWTQEWRGPLRSALDWLRDTLAPGYEEKGRELFKDPWQARDDYLSVILDRSAENVDRFLGAQASHPLSDEEVTRALKLLELQRHAMLMYTSCGWFFDELTGVETVQVIQYAGRALQLAQELFGDHLESEFLERLELAKSNIPEHRDGRLTYEKFVRPVMVDLPKVGAHYAVNSLFETLGPETRIYCYTVSREDYKLLSAGKAKLGLGRAKITSEITRESARVTFGVLHLGDQNLSGGVQEFHDEPSYNALIEKITEAFGRGDFPDLIHLVDNNFGPGTYTLKLLFRDEQRKILRIILEAALSEAEAVYRHFYENHAPLMAFVAAVGMPQPRRFQIAAEFTLNADLQRALEAEPLDLARIKALLEEQKRLNTALDVPTLEFALRRKLEAMAERLRARPTELPLLEELESAAAFARQVPFDVNLWLPQNLYYQMMETVYPEMRERAERGEETAQAWVQHFRTLGESLRVRVE
ncbi:MAG TPA: DUF3536 domain-containing protein [Candidatus Acidoferrales bacterium]|nr:DUF3536 domain-containing protein [Candidatus Acidoferrales bacterium]